MIPHLMRFTVKRIKYNAHRILKIVFYGYFTVENRKLTLRYGALLLRRLGAFFVLVIEIRRNVC